MKSIYKRIHTLSSLITATAVLASGLLQSAVPAAAEASAYNPISALAATAAPEANLFEAFASDWKRSLSSASSSSDSLFISPDIDTSSTGPVSVIIQLSAQPAAVGKYAASKGYKTLAAEANVNAVQTEQASFLKSATASGLPLDVDYRYNQVLNGMAVTLPGTGIAKLAKLPGIRAIYPNLTYTAKPVQSYETDAEDPRIDMTPLQQLGVDKAWAEGYTGKGLKVGVIDTGVDYVHPDLKGAFKGGHDSFYNDDDPYEDIPVPEQLVAGTTHGTHVSGTIAGRAANVDGHFLQKGVAYESDLYVYKVLGGPLATGTSAMIVDGIEHAVKDGMDVINLSLGDDGTKDPYSAEAVAINNAALAGVVPVIAAGNSAMDAPYYYSLGSPSTAELGITVGAATSRIDTYETVASSSLTGQAYTLRAMAWSPGNTDFASLLGTDPIGAVYLGFGLDADYDGKDVTGKIVIVTRTHSSQGISFSRQINSAKEHGAKAVVIFNGTTNDSRDVWQENTVDLSESIPGRDGPIGYMGFNGPLEDSIPAFDIAGKEGRALVRAMLKQPNAPESLTFDKPFKSVSLPGDTMAEFSSRGPNQDDRLGIKPDVVAPGHRIVSSVPAFGLVHPDADYDEAYDRYSGTSMATPHIAGLALLLKDKFPNWTPSDVRAALANTSDPLADENGLPYDVYSQGAGRADVANALHTAALLKSLDEITILDKNMKPITLPSEASSVAFGVLDPSAGDAKAASTLQLKSVTDKSVAYEAKTELHKTFTNKPGYATTPDWAGITVKLTGLDAGSKLSVDAGKARTFGLSVEAKPDAKPGVYEGTVVLEGDSVPALHLPFVFHIGKKPLDNENAFGGISVSNRIVSPQSPIDIAINYNGGGFNILQLGLLDNNGRYYGLLADWKSSKNGLDAYMSKGTYVIEGFNGSYLSAEQDSGANGSYDLPALPDGQYVLSAVTAYSVFGFTSEIHFSNITINVDNDYTGGDQPGGGNPGDGNPGGGNGGQPGGGSPQTSDPVPTDKYGDVTTSVIADSQAPVKLVAKTSSASGKLTATIDDTELDRAFESAAKSTAFVITATSADAEEAVLSLTPAQAQRLKAAPPESSVVLAWNGASVALPLSAIRSLSQDAGLAIRIKKNGAAVKRFEAVYPDAKVVGTPIAFEASSVKDGIETPIPLSVKDTITRAFLIDGDVQAANAGALYEEDGAVRPATATFKTGKDGGTIAIVARPGFSTYAAAVRDIAFSDIGTSWAKEEIRKLAAQFIMNGTASGTFAPKRNVTRAEFASMLVRALGLKTPGTTAPFTDVNVKDWFAAEVAAAHAAGLVTGEHGRFQPNAVISRQDMAVMLNRSLKLLNVNPPASGSSVYSDAGTIGAYAINDIRAVTDAGLMNGIDVKGDRFFHPAEATTREAAATVLYRLLQAAKRIN
ncbi:S8 family serine peptidase [Paenibacillus glycanilyticus]|uniref:S8 family serine peptidase n=1 Tax=Paenibacillus glycanilyticus TaxID=126569 RepID=UPI00203E09E1|nr:S8 family serine peptidase [Paenibacillus glycanilyticus]MCM3630533.1 S8 family serine peptidase [Paenibacillus glycanilyticus]